VRVVFNLFCEGIRQSGEPPLPDADREGLTRYPSTSDAGRF
jgi:hypothetical protein